MAHFPSSHLISRYPSRIAKMCLQLEELYLTFNNPSLCHKVISWTQNGIISNLNRLKGAQYIDGNLESTLQIAISKLEISLTDRYSWRIRISNLNLKKIAICLLTFIHFIICIARPSQHP
jgi:hypothetical protein